MPREEYLSEDIVDSNFAKIFAPIHIAQLFLGSSHNDLRDGFMMPVTACQKLYSFVILVLSTYSYYHFSYFYIGSFCHISFPLCLTLQSGVTIQFIIFISNVYHARFSSNCDATAKLYLALQKLDRILNLRVLQPFAKKHYQFNYFMVVLTATFYPCGYLIHVFFFLENAEKTLFFGFFIMVIYMENLITGSLIYYAGKRLQLVNRIMEVIFLNTDNDFEFDRDNFLQLEQTFGIIVTENVYEQKQSVIKISPDLKDCIKTVFKSYKLIIKRFRFCASTIVFTVYSYTFIIIEAVIVGQMTDLFPLIAVVTICIWIVYYYLQLTILAITVDWFGRQVKQTKTICNHALSIFYKGPKYTLAKDVRRFLEQDPPMFSIYGIFVINRALPMNLLGHIANNLVILLQFTL